MRKKKNRVTVHAHTTIKELLDHYPETAAVFFRRKMACVGCPAEEFGSLKDAARSYQVNLQDLIREIKTAVDGADE